MNSTTPPPHDEQGVESLIRAAGGYVDVSADLRPRVFESVRAERRSQRSRQSAVLLTAAAVLLAIGVATIGQTLSGVVSGSTAKQRLAQLEQQAEQRYSRNEATFGWALIDALFSFRAEKAQALNPAEGAISGQSVAQTEAPQGSY